MDAPSKDNSSSRGKSLMPDLGPYVGRWVALVADRVVGVGQSKDEARHMATQNRPKEKHVYLFVSPQVQIAYAAERQPLIQALFDLAKAQDITVYLVGGTVRDLLLGRETHDLDFAVCGDGLRLARHIADRLGGAFVALDQERKTGRVILPPRSSAENCTPLPANSGHALPKPLYLDFASLRGADLHADLQDRDFTINAMALERTSGGELRLIDPLCGSDDLANLILRAALPTSFIRDPVRTLRAVRMQAQFGCRIEPQTRAWLRAAVPQIKAVSAERVRDEWFNIMQQPTASSALRELHQLGLLSVVAPPLAALAGLEQSAPHRFDALTHSFETVRAVEQLWDALCRHESAQMELPHAFYDLASQIRERYESPICDERTHLALLKCAALLHDVGKPQTKTVDQDGRTRFIGHERVGAEIAGALVRGWRCSNAEADMVRTAIGSHMRPTWLAAQQTVSRRAIYRFYRDTGVYGIDAGFVALADHLATWGQDLSSGRWKRQAEIVATLWAAYLWQREVVVAPPPLLSGRDLIAIGVSPGPEVGALLERVREAQAAGEIETRQQALAQVKAWLTQTDAQAG
jgi:poly(A) polymerase